jgi:hypothetical protein
MGKHHAIESGYSRPKHLLAEIWARIHHHHLSVGLQHNAGAQTMVARIH